MWKLFWNAEIPGERRLAAVQLVEVIKKFPQTKEALKDIQGFGTKKVDKYGDSITEILKTFHQKKPLYQNSKVKPPSKSQLPFNPDKKPIKQPKNEE